MQDEKRPIVLALKRAQKLHDELIASGKENKPMSPIKSVKRKIKRCKSARRPKPSLPDKSKSTKKNRKRIALAKKAIKEGVFGKKNPDKTRVKWEDEDKRLILDVCSKFETRSAAIRHLQTCPQYHGRYINIRESTVRGIEKSAKNRIEGKQKRIGRRPVLEPETVNKICEMIKERSKESSTAISSRTLVPLIEEVVRLCGEYEKIRSGEFKVSFSWINKLRSGIK